MVFSWLWHNQEEPSINNDPEGFSGEGWWSEEGLQGARKKWVQCSTSRKSEEVKIDKGHFETISWPKPLFFTGYSTINFVQGFLCDGWSSALHQETWRKLPEVWSTSSSSQPGTGWKGTTGNSGTVGNWQVYMASVDGWHMWADHGYTMVREEEHKGEWAVEITQTLDTTDSRSLFPSTGCSLNWGIFCCISTHGYAWVNGTTWATTTHLLG